jgi:hypothetical protein
MPIVTEESQSKRRRLPLWEAAIVVVALTSLATGIVDARKRGYRAGVTYRPYWSRTFSSKWDSKLEVWSGRGQPGIQKVWFLQVAPIRFGVYKVDRDDS